MPCKSQVERIHQIGLLGFVTLVALLEGPAEIACVFVVLTTGFSGQLKNWRPKWYEIAIVVWWGCGLIGLLTSDVQIPSEDKFRPLLALAFIVGRYSLGSNPSDVRLRKLGWFFCAACVLNSLNGYLQLGFGQLPWDQLFLKSPGSPQIYVPGRLGMPVLSGLFYNRLKLAHVGIVGLSILLVFIAASPPRQIRSSSSLALLGVALLGPAIVLTQARMAIAAFLAAGGLLALLVAQRRLMALLIGLSIAALLALSLSDLGAERMSHLAADLKIRGTIYGVAGSIIAEHPWLGVGHGVYRIEAANYFQEGWSRTWLIDAHLLFLHTWAETGLLGLLAFCSVLFGGIYRLARRVRKAARRTDAFSMFERSVLFGLLALSILGLTHFPLHHAPVALIFWAFCGVAYRDPPKENEIT